MATLKPARRRPRWRKIMRLLFSRVAALALILIIESVWLTLAFWKFDDYLGWTRAFSSVFSLLAAIFLMCREENPAYKLTWIFMLLVFPVFGFLLYVTFGNKRPARHLRKRLEREEEARKNCLVGIRTAKLPPDDDRLTGTIHYLQDYGGFVPFSGTDVDYFPLGEALFSRLLSDLAGAERYIFMEYFIVAEGSIWEQLCDILIDRAAHGVDVRLIYDDVGSVAVLPPHMREKLRGAGVKVMAFNPVVPFLTLAFNNRDHRKISVIDGKVAYTGGVNIADEYVNRTSPYGHWKDTGLRLCGEGVTGFTVMFLKLWNALRPTDTDYAPFLLSDTHAPSGVGGIVQPFCDTPLDEENLAENVYLDILSQARDYVYIYTPYLIIDHEMQTALTLAAKRGVDVRIVTPGVPDKKMVFHLTRSYYDALLSAGVKIYEYTPGFLHAKSFVCDDRIAVVGTINLDYRSLYLHFECGALMADMPAVMDVKEDYLKTLTRCRAVARRESRKYSTLSLGYRILRILSPLL